MIGVPVVIAALVAVVTSTSRSRTGRPAEGVGREGPARGVDRAGAALLVVAPACAVTAIIQGPGNAVLGGAMVAAAVGAGFALWRVERRAPRPLLSVPPTARRPLAVACGIAAVMNLCGQGTLFVLTQVFQAVHGLSPLAAGLVMLPAMVPLPLLGTVSGRITSRFGPWRTSALGLLIAVAGLIGLALSLEGPNHPVLWCSLAVWGAGTGILTPGIVTAGMRTVPGSPGAASGAGNTSRQAGGAMGVALFGALAGTPAGPLFARHVGTLMWMGATLFLVAAAICFFSEGRPQEQQA